MPCSSQEGVFPGLIPVLNSYLESMEVDVDTRCSILNYLKSPPNSPKETRTQNWKETPRDTEGPIK